jgi:hypothetical protein
MLRVIFHRGLLGGRLVADRGSFSRKLPNDEARLREGLAEAVAQAASPAAPRSYLPSRVVGASAERPLAVRAPTRMRLAPGSNSRGGPHSSLGPDLIARASGSGPGSLATSNTSTAHQLVPVVAGIEPSPAVPDCSEALLMTQPDAVDQRVYGQDMLPKMDVTRS